MPITKEMKKTILKALREAPIGATMAEVEEKTGMERHTLAKYLSVLKGQGEVDYRLIGRSKLWLINKAPLKAILSAEPDTAAERVLKDIIAHLPMRLMAMDKEWRITYLNERAKDTYGAIKGKEFYNDVLGLQDPMSMNHLRSVVEGRAEEASEERADAQGEKRRFTAFRTGGGIMVLIDEPHTTQKGS